MVVSDEYSALHHRFIPAVFGFTPDHVPITLSVPENGSLVIGGVPVPRTRKDRLSAVRLSTARMRPKQLI
jgi:hypothetical protein